MSKNTTKTPTQSQDPAVVAAGEARSLEPLEETCEAAGQAVSGIRNILAEVAGFEAEVKSITRRSLFKIGGSALAVAATVSAGLIPSTAVAGSNIEALYREWQRTRAIALKGYLYANTLIDKNLRDARLRSIEARQPITTDGLEGYGAKGVMAKADAADERTRILELRIIDIVPQTSQESEIKAEVVAVHAERFGSWTAIGRNLHVLVKRYGGTYQALAHLQETGEI